MLCFKVSHKLQKQVTGSLTNENGRKKKKAGLLHMLSSNSKQLQSIPMDLEYVTERIIVVLFPEIITDAHYRAGLKELTSLLRKKYPERYKVLNVSKKRSDLGRLHPVEEFGWPEELAPPLDRLCTVCKMMETWLAAGAHNIVVIHCKGGHSRAAIVVSAYMHYISICGHEEASGSCFAMQRFSERFLGYDGQPSHKRYVNYFASLLSGKTKISPATVYLNQICLSNLPGRSVLFKIYEGMQPTQSTQIMQTHERTVIDLCGLPLRGDVLVKCFERTKTSERAPLFRCQFNTCTFDLANSQGDLYNLKFHKEDMDDIFKDISIDNQATVEFVFLTDAPINRNRKSITDWSRADSYENFDKEDEDFCEAAVANSSTTSPAEGHRAAESTDSGIASDSPNAAKEKNAMPAGTQLKSRSVSAVSNGPSSPSDTNDAKQSEQVTTRAHSALPAAVRPPPTGRSASPLDTSTASGIEPDLVAKDRYDPASKCFSYVPARALNEHFTTPRKPIQWMRVEEPREKILDAAPLPSEIASVPVVSTDLVRRADTPKWDDEIDKVAEEYTRRLSESESKRSEAPSVILEPKENRVAADEAPEDISAEIEEKPTVCDQAKRATKRRKTKCDSYQTLNHDTHNSDMDDLCDPEFYLNCDIPQTTTAAQFPKEKILTNGSVMLNARKTPTTPLPAAKTNGFRSTELPRKSYTPLPETLRDTSRDALSSPKPATSLSELNYNDRDAFRFRNCRSATSAPLYSERMHRLYDRSRYDSVTDAENADDWLRYQLNKLKDRRERNPEVLRRKRQEKLLLEELKSASDSRQAARGIDERSYSVEGVGHRSDPLSEYRMEEERLRMTDSPFPDGKDRDEAYAPRRVMPPKPMDVVRHKPPTPPPRAISRSPPGSPYPRRPYARTPTLESAYQYERRNLLRNDDFSQSEENDYRTPRMTYQPQTAKSILKKREAYNESPSPMNARRPPVEDSSVASLNRSATPAFPVRKETPLPYHPLLANSTAEDGPHSINYRPASPRSLYYAQSGRSSVGSLESSEVIHHHPIFVKDTSKYWYKPTISREEAINILRDKPPGTFLVRDSNSFPGAFGLALKVATPPPGVHPGDGTELVRHFLIEPSPKGVKLKGCSNEPVFGTLSALVYQHSITPLALPTKLILPEYDPATVPERVSAAQALLQQGAACNVTYIASVDCESLTGPEAIRRCVGEAFELYNQKRVQPVSVHFKVSARGVTVTDNTRQLFFRRHYPVEAVIFAGIDPADRRWDNSYMAESMSEFVKTARTFAFVARKPGGYADNACHVFAELEQEQPASAVVNFITKVMMGRKS